MLLMRDEHADESDVVGSGELRHEETGEVYSIVYEGQGKKFKVTGACATCIWKAAATQLAACMILCSCGRPRAADNLPVLRGDAGVRGRTARPDNDAYDGV